MRNCLISVVLVVFCVKIWAQQQRVDSNPCVGKTACGECIGVAAACAWCQKEGYGSDRCDTLVNHVLNGCNNATDLVNPDHERDVLQNDNVRDARPDESADKAVQVQPQRVSLRIRPNKPATIRLKFRQAANYPVDLYFLMDLSQSMADDKNKTASLAKRLASEIRQLTRNLRLAFGSFVDKVTLPFTSTEPGKLKNPCKNCAPPYSFKHILPFTDSIDAFQKAVHNGKISGNLDTPEGGFDAMMQVAVCGKEIGWRDVSRKLLIYSSDAPYHAAGDGKLAGIVIPNDGKCHLDADGFYTAGLDMDYPSIGQMREAIREQNINVIFAITDVIVKVYNQTSTMLEGSTVGVLNSDSSNIVDLVRDNYKRISSKVELYARNTKGLTLQYRSRCLGSEMTERKSCEGLKIGDSVTFDIEIEAAECPADKSQSRRQVVIGPVGLKDNLIIDLDIICDCDCQHPDQAEEKSPRCSDGNGTFACGVCSCNPGRRGRVCECDANQQDLEEDLDEDQISTCLPQNTSLVCSGHGECVCGQCHCNRRTPGSVERFSGRFCECDDYSCDLHDGMLCGGPTRGRCRCGTCLCHADYNGTACDCPITINTCVAPSGEICNGNGVCSCGKCKCDRESRCYGDFCENCPSCVGNCNCNKECVNCRLFQRGVYSEEECADKCAHINITEVHTLGENDNGTICQEKFDGKYDDQSDCTFKFSYEYGPDNKLRIKAQKVTVCPEPVDILPIILGVVGSVLIGLIILVIWKICVTVYDHREYNRFKEEINRAQWGAERNPLYRDAIQTFENPTCETTVQRRR